MTARGERCCAAYAGGDVGVAAPGGFQVLKDVEDVLWRDARRAHVATFAMTTYCRTDRAAARAVDVHDGAGMCTMTRWRAHDAAAGVGMTTSRASATGAPGGGRLRARTGPEPAMWSSRGGPKPSCGPDPAPQQCPHQPGPGRAE